MTRTYRMGILLILYAVLLVGCNPADKKTLPQGWMRIVPPEDVNALAEQGEYIWAGGRDGLFLVRRESGELMELPACIPKLAYVRDLLVDADNILHVAHAGGLGSFDGAAWSDDTTRLGLPPGPATALYQSPEKSDGALWVGNEMGVCSVQGQEIRCLGRKDGLGLDSVDAMLMDYAGRMWFASASQIRGGLSMYDGRAWHHFHVEEGLPHNRVNALLLDNAGALHVATGFAENGGACTLRDKTWSALRQDDGLAGAVVRSLYQDKQGRMYYGSEFNGMAVFMGDKHLILRPENGLVGAEVKEMLQDAQGALWLATNKGLNKVHDPADLEL